MEKLKGSALWKGCTKAKLMLTATRESVVHRCIKILKKCHPLFYFRVGGIMTVLVKPATKTRLGER
jgi:hypothetical protein